MKKFMSFLVLALFLVGISAMSFGYADDCCKKPEKKEAAQKAKTCWKWKKVKVEIPCKKKRVKKVVRRKGKAKKGCGCDEKYYY